MLPRASGDRTRYDVDPQASGWQVSGIVTGFNGGSPAFSRDIAGSGIASLQPFHVPDDGIDAILTRYEFHGSTG
jgi:hypothetical protein